jgi:cellulose synthase/poly-beta-1,6-N-acetylglucosamine synthase-like glycosyltransferase
VKGTIISLSITKELAWSRVAFWTTIAVSSGCLFTYLWQLARGSLHSFESIAQVIIALPLLYGNIVYQVSRWGALHRELKHRPVPRQRLERIYDEGGPELAILIPSYKEEPKVLSQTLMSAALVEYPRRQVVVLIDDPPADQAAHTQSWGAIDRISDCLKEPAAKMRFELEAYYDRADAGALDPIFERGRIASLYRSVAQWLDECAANFRAEWGHTWGHADEFFVRCILQEPAEQHRARASKIAESLIEKDQIGREYLRLSALVDARIDSFERKMFDNLSHAPNKAMNLNSYIGLLGRRLRSTVSGSSTVLEDAADDEAEFIMPDSEFIITLDADSIILPDYAMRLINVMQSNPRVAVAQTPYSAFPNAPSALERTAGATTDIQYFAHQGAAEFNAGYWVGANALLRVSALRDIQSEVLERGYRVPVFIQERTLIEDTGSTIDLIQRGWSVHNYPQRLAFSATPPDFGALIIQRKRWSNGGLIILPDLLRWYRSKGSLLASWMEAFLRMHYLLSPTIGSVVVLALLLYPFEPVAAAVWLPFLSAPYFYLYGRDLVRAGYRWGDLKRVYALNLILVPVCLAGVILSVRQIRTGEKPSFGRTPKIDQRTAIPPLYFWFNVSMLGAMVCSIFYAALWSENIARGLFPAFNGVFYAYGLVQLVGFAEGWTDTLTWRDKRSQGRRHLLERNSSRLEFGARVSAFGRRAREG